MIITRSKIYAASNSRVSTRDMIKVDSSNIWGYHMEIPDRRSKVGDLYVQFKSARGGPEDIYVLYGVPVVLFRRFVAAPSKGHFYWQYFRDKYPYAKLTGDKRTKMRGGVNSKIA